MTTIGVAIPSIPIRAHLLTRALESVTAQYHPVDHISITIDRHRQGAAITRDRAWHALNTEWVAFLDDDDEMKPTHIGMLLEHATLTDADLVYPWFDVIAGGDPFPMFEGRPWDDAEPHQIPITWLCKRALLERVGGFAPGFDPLTGADDGQGNRAGEDYMFVLNAIKAGATISHLNARTWNWFHNSGNTSGRPDRW